MQHFLMVCFEKERNKFSLDIQIGRRHRQFTNPGNARTEFFLNKKIKGKTGRYEDEMTLGKQSDRTKETGTKQLFFVQTATIHGLEKVAGIRNFDE